MDFAGKSDEYIAETFVYLHQRNAKTMVENGGAPKIDAQVMSVALAAFSTSENLAGTIARDYNFTTSANGIAYFSFNVLNVLTMEEAEKLGLSQDNGNMTIINILAATNELATLGLLHDFDADSNGDGNGTIDDIAKLLRKLANELYSEINWQAAMETTTRSTRRACNPALRTPC